MEKYGITSLPPRPCSSICPPWYTTIVLFMSTAGERDDVCVAFPEDMDIVIVLGILNRLVTFGHGSHLAVYTEGRCHPLATAPVAMYVPAVPSRTTSP